MSQAHYESPDSISAVLDLLDQHGVDAKLVAGGQSLMLQVRQNMLDAEVFVDISDIPTLRGVERTEDDVRIMSATSYNRCHAHSVSTTYSVLGDAISAIADRQVRNVGTIGGALAHADPALDIVPALMCLDADIVLVDSSAERVVPLEDYLVGPMETIREPDELIKAVRFDRQPGGERGSAYHKHAIVSGGWPTVGVGANLRLDGDRITAARIALAAVDYTAVTAPTLESKLTGMDVDGVDLEAISPLITEDINPVSDYSGSIEHKEHLAGVLSRRAVESACERAGSAGD